MNPISKRYLFPCLIGLLAFLPNPLTAAQTNATGENAWYQNTAFVSFLLIIFCLIVVIAILGMVIKNISKSDFVRQRHKNHQNKAGMIILLFSLCSFGASAATGGIQDTNDSIWGIEHHHLAILLGIIFLELLIIFQMTRTIHQLLHTKKREETASGDAFTMMDKWNQSVDIADEEHILLHHEYDGIRELDNNLPPWWKYGFYLTIVFSVGYMIHYHVSKTGDLQDSEYSKQMETSKQEVEAYLKEHSGNIDENNVKLLSTPGDLEAGAQVYQNNCVACHGAKGEGTVGPNLCDEYWLHGGSLPEVFKSIKYGWKEKGMKPWADDFSPLQIAQLSAYILSLQGSNPPNAKEAQGEKTGATEAPTNDSTGVKTDSTQTKAN